MSISYVQERKVFEGQWVNGKRTGPGKLSWQNGEEFTGEFQENLQTGQGEHKFPSGHYDIAGWDKGLRHGAATYFHPDIGKVINVKISIGIILQKIFSKLVSFFNNKE